MTDAAAKISAPPAFDPALLQGRSIALIGLMGVGKTTVGRRLARRLGLPFRDADAEIEAAARLSIADIFAELGEAEFRAGEHRVIRRLLEGPSQVLATGGGAVLNAETRKALKARAVTIWLRAEPEVLAERATRRDTRPLLKDADPLAVLTRLQQAREPFYREAADLIVETGAGPHSRAVDAVLAALSQWAGRK
ncbi:shikimate kinase [Brevundimonas sp. 2R-24]|uniref:Shikimate kinase n=1 Tax=Peiella sedimenti TaxID=3061083 RepID=A0ABT8SM28_9CAUL|nr:shikimate kinase [Caulobacteraceae bacterium XZ-24]